MTGRLVKLTAWRPPSFPALGIFPLAFTGRESELFIAVDTPVRVQPF
jgi:hypothetical protein